MSDSPTTDRVDEHVVFFTTAQGDPAAERYPSLSAAVSRVEALANDEGIQDAKVFGLVPVPLRVRSYFRVEVGTDAADVPAAPDVPPPSATQTDGEASSPVESDEVRDALLGAVDASAAGEDASAREETEPGEEGQDGGSEDVLPSRGRNLGFFTH